MTATVVVEGISIVVVVAAVEVIIASISSVDVVVVTTPVLTTLVNKAVYVVEIYTVAVTVDLTSDVGIMRQEHAEDISDEAKGCEF
jgi:multisubunit Na+/H+ antiporter MnhG subunit